MKNSISILKMDSSQFKYLEDKDISVLKIEDNLERVVKECLYEMVETKDSETIIDFVRTNGRWVLENLCYIREIRNPKSKLYNQKQICNLINAFKVLKSDNYSRGIDNIFDMRYFQTDYITDKMRNQLMEFDSDLISYFQASVLKSENLVEDVWNLVDEISCELKFNIYDYINRDNNQELMLLELLNMLDGNDILLDDYTVGRKEFAYYLRSCYIHCLRNLVELFNLYIETAVKERLKRYNYPIKLNQVIILGDFYREDQDRFILNNKE